MKDWTIKIADFGWAKSIVLDKEVSIKAKHTPYQAPEFLYGNVPQQDVKVDVWSAGCLLAQFYNDGVSLLPNYSSKNDDHLRKLVELNGMKLIVLP